MALPEVEEFARTLVQQVRDAAIRNCDALLLPQASSPPARRWRDLAATADALRAVIPDVVDQAVFEVLRAIDEGFLPLRYVSSSGREINLADGLGELSGWYMGAWREKHSTERHFDDFADLPTPFTERGGGGGGT